MQKGKEALVKARAGTGKSVAFLLVAETSVLLKYHDGLNVQGLVGGTRFKDDVKCLKSNPCQTSQILVATPGRLLNHIESRSGISVRLMGLKMLVLDEAGCLLDLGFRKDLERIIDCLPHQRQSLLFSATIPKEVQRVSQLVLKRDHALILNDSETTIWNGSRDVAVFFNWIDFEFAPYVILLIMKMASIVSTNLLFLSGGSLSPMTPKDVAYF
ncbi:hypothetical protein Dimus_023103 [Dionaea muscipula]